ncbi:hypothetical protein [Algoriphagus mannitolivorans]|uniref:hypothetical protein n=1 Tax=Algoriphagus mannitolivorans TaxID=226504 RepID=UPI000424860C|nr:hypothetical protein [Algoriphagus mannitolivorans]
MKKNIFHLVLGTAILGIIFSCKTYRNVENLKPAVSKEIQEGPFVKESLSKLNEGDKVIVYLITGEKYYLNYKQINGKDLVGIIGKLNKEKIEPNQRLEIPIDHIEKVYVYRFSAAATTPVVLISALGIFVGIVAIIWSSGGGFGW